MDSNRTTKVTDATAQTQVEATREVDGPGPIAPGSLLGNYRIERLLGRGGMGEVYLGTHTGLDRKVAIKMLAGRYSDDARWLERFHREAKMLAKLDHPNAVSVFDYGNLSGREYIVMEYVDGNDVEQVIKKRGQMRPADALAIGKRVCMALAAAHRMEIIHRDIKPGNILVTQKKVKVADFGLSRPLDSDSAATQEGQIIGTPHYMSPEQCQGMTLGATSDLYSLGATLYHMIAGQPPYQAKQPLAVLVKHTDTTVQPPKLSTLVEGLHPEVEEVIERLMGQTPEERYPDAEAATAAIDHALQIARAGQPPRRPKKTTPWVFYTVVALAVLFGLIIASADKDKPGDGAASSTSSALPERAQQAVIEFRALVDDPATTVAQLAHDYQAKRSYAAARDALRELYIDGLRARLEARDRELMAAFFDGQLGRVLAACDPAMARARPHFEQELKQIRGVARDWLKLTELPIVRTTLSMDGEPPTAQVHHKETPPGGSEITTMLPYRLIDPEGDAPLAWYLDLDALDADRERRSQEQAAALRVNTQALAERAATGPVSVLEIGLARLPLLLVPEAHRGPLMADLELAQAYAEVRHRAARDLVPTISRPLPKRVEGLWPPGSRYLQLTQQLRAKVAADGKRPRGMLKIEVARLSKDGAIVHCELLITTVKVVGKPQSRQVLVAWRKTGSTWYLDAEAMGLER